LFTISAHAQLGKGAWHWQFGDSCALDFSSGAPVATKSSLDVVEGTASISDKNTGQLLFYTDGTSVWDKNNNQMPNGFGMYGGYGTSTQAALIIPLPGSSTIYYLITADQGGYRPQPMHGINYSIVDMSLNGGLGDVTIKNNPLVPPPAGEKLVGVKHCNGNDYWVITHPFTGNSFNVYLLNSSGLNTVPIISNVGTPEDSLFDGFYPTIGYLKASSNGRKLALAIYDMQIFEIYDFNSSTGVVSNPITIHYSNPLESPYGVCFSPDNSKVYVSLDNAALIYQYDLSSNIPSNIIASETAIATHIPAPEGMQLGPDGKIYVSLYYVDSNSVNSLSVINNPNNLGTSCNFQLYAVPLASGSHSKLGLPNFINTDDSISVNISKNISLCNFSSYTLSADSGSNYHWSNGNSSDTIVINIYGKYWLSFTDDKGCQETDTFNVLPVLPPIVNILHDTSICNYPNSFVIINATDSNVTSYLWNNGSTTPLQNISNPGLYWVNYTFTNLCAARDSFYFIKDSLPSINLGKDTEICVPSYTLFANANEFYVWNTGDTSQQIVVTNTGNYSVLVTSHEGCKNSDTVSVTFFTAPRINILRDSVECGNLFIPVNINATYSNTINYLWSNGFTLPIQTISSPGLYWVNYFFKHGCISTDSFNLTIQPYPIINLGNDTTFCLGDLPLSAYNNSSTYLWSTGQITSNIIVNIPNTYWVKVINQYGCMNYDTLVVKPETSLFNFVMPNIVTPNNDGINDFIDFSKYQFSTFQLEIYNRWGIKVYESTSPNCIWKPIEDDGTYFYSAQYIINCGIETQNKTLKGFITINR
jgi:hypothetical protein